MTKMDDNFKKAVNYIITEGSYDVNPRPYWLEEDGRHTPAHTKFVTAYTTEYRLDKGEFPMLTLRPSPWKTAIKELFWIFVHPSNSIQELEEKYGIYYWRDWNVGDDTIGYRYGHTVKRFDLFNKLLNDIKNNPYGRRHILSLWQDIEFDEELKGLHPCCFQTLWTVDGEYLDMTLIQRSGDLLGASIGINEIQYAGLLVMVAWECGLKPRKFTHFIQNLHIYDRHIPICLDLCEREEVECSPMLVIDTDKTSIFDLDINDFKMIGYPMNEIKEKNPQVKFPLAI